MHTQPSIRVPLFLVKTKTCISFSILVFLVLSSVIASAQTWYIKPSAEIPLRRGQGSDYRILAIVPNGTAVSIVEENESWAKVTTDEDKEGWILKRYLTTEPPLNLVVNELQRESQQFKEKIEKLTAENEEYKEFNIALKNTIEKTTKELASTTEKYDQLVNDTSDVIQIKNSLEKSRKTIKKLQQELNASNSENGQLKSSQNIRWFLAGGGTLVFGIIVGMISSRSKKRKSTLY